jgi:DNA-binding transcriptional MerR regulator/methylmalonyl-CoA mutase cobalamin-binding subunit
MNYTVKAAALATGVSESRLRTWERRYGIPRPGRGPTGRRLYDDDDLVVIRRMAALVNAGISAHEAAEAALAGTNSTSSPPHPAERAAVQRLADAAQLFDEGAFLEVFRSEIKEIGWANAFDEVIFPTLIRVGLRWESAFFAPANEHFASELFNGEIAASTQALPPTPDNAPCVIIACPQDERHDIGLRGLSMILRSQGIRTIYLGADVPAGDLVTAYEGANANAICLSATTAIGLASLVRTSRVLVGTHRLRVFIGGPATSYSGIEAAGTPLPTSMQAAVDAIVSVLT